ncbi:hypothetical protein SLEP1_g1880 [Rubroshorea leprosula]|uniref:Calmodulin-binding domain-containing protein n=1 Tax=Rubroshorea leprosula TaxID=152421 RepID=A0AAV5HPS7_9ROSI|nr:hypothetical protein SLEP1_g1880 [Rubroshorea leprosula]
MATSRRDGIVGREKRGPSPVNSSIASTQRSTKSSTSPSPGKQANYLRPTAVSSRTEPSKNVKKPGSVSDQDTPPKAAPLRRRSLDRPDPSAAGATKSLISSSGPKDNNKPKTMRSVSFSPKSRPPSPKPTVERTSKTTKAITGKSHTLSLSNSMKKPVTLSSTTKKDSVSKKSLSTSSTIHDTKQEINVETKNEIDESPVHDVEKVEAPDIPQSHIEKELDVVNTEVKNGEEVDEDTIFDIATVPEEQNLSQIDEEILYGEKSDPEDLLERDENAKNDGDSQEKIETEAESKMEENAVDEKEGTSEEEEEVKDNRVEIETKNEVENKEANEGSQKLTEEVDNSGVVEAKPETVNVTFKLQTVAAQGKKESPTAYNDVIEETASKLLEKRKNKVKALVGAFETVIDYETAASK